MNISFFYSINKKFRIKTIIRNECIYYTPQTRELLTWYNIVKYSHTKPFLSKSVNILYDTEDEALKLINDKRNEPKLKFSKYKYID